MDETWKPIPGYTHYEVSDLGRVRNGSGRILKQRKTSKGDYRKVTLCQDGRARDRRVHQLVLEAFIGPRPKGYKIVKGEWPGRAGRDAARALHPKDRR